MSDRLQRKNGVLAHFVYVRLSQTLLGTVRATGGGGGNANERNPDQLRCASCRRFYLTGNVTPGSLAQTEAELVVATRYSIHQGDTEIGDSNSRGKQEWPSQYFIAARNATEALYPVGERTKPQRRGLPNTWKTQSACFCVDRRS